MFKNKSNRLITLVITMALLAIGSFLLYYKAAKKDVLSKAESGKVTVVSDVDAHSQSQMRVTVEGDSVIAIKGDPKDPESKGELNIRDKKVKKILYAPDRLKYPMKRIGERGENKWERISWDEALTTIANKLNEVKKKYGAEAIDFHHGHYHSGEKYDGFLKGFLTPSKKVEIYSEKLEKLGYDPLPVYREPAESPVSCPELAREYPFILIAGSKLKMYTHSMMRNIPDLRKLMPKNLLEINPVAAEKLGIKDGDIVRVESLRGSIRSLAKVTEIIDPRVVHLYYGFQESNCNILTDHKAFDPITGSVGLKSSLCKVIKDSIKQGLKNG